MDLIDTNFKAAMPWHTLLRQSFLNYDVEVMASFVGVRSNFFIDPRVKIQWMIHSSSIFSLLYQKIVATASSLNHVVVLIWRQ